jgi:hypothetical protein
MYSDLLMSSTFLTILSLSFCVLVYESDLRQNLVWELRST